jgi:hypothetical protein
LHNQDLFQKARSMVFRDKSIERVLRANTADSNRDRGDSFSKRTKPAIKIWRTTAPSRQKTTLSEALNPFEPAVTGSSKNLQPGNNARLTQPKALSIMFLLSPSWSDAVRSRVPCRMSEGNLGPTRGSFSPGSVKRRNKRDLSQTTPMKEKAWCLARLINHSLRFIHPGP